MLPLEIAVYTLVALASTAVATPTPTRGLKQATRANVVRRIKRGVRPRAPVPSGAGGAPETVRTSSTQSGGLNYARYFTGSGAILSASPYGEDPDFPSKYTTYANTVSTASAAQQCVDFAYGNDRIGVALWFDESDDLWHCRATFNPNRASDFTAADANARPVYGYNYAAA